MRNTDRESVRSRLTRGYIRTMLVDIQTIWIARRDAVQSIRHQIIVASQDALDVECRTGGRVGISIARADGPMTAIIYFGEMLVVSVLAIFLLAISPLRVAAAASFAGGAFCAARSRAKKAWDSSRQS